MQKEITTHAVVAHWRGGDCTVSVNIEGYVSSNYYGTNLNLTGYANWFGSQNMCRMLGECADSLFGIHNHINLLELGSGLGRAGIMAAKILETCAIPHSAVLTDGEEEMVSLLSANCVSNGCASSECKQLLWGENETFRNLRNCYIDGFDIIIGADLLYGGKQSVVVCEQLFYTVSSLLSRKSGPASVFYLAFTRREHITIEKICDLAKKYHLVMSVCEDYTLDIFENNVETDSMFWRDTILAFVLDAPTDASSDIL